jgi:galactonate dehydratase
LLITEAFLLQNPTPAPEAPELLLQVLTDQEDAVGLAEIAGPLPLAEVETALDELWPLVQGQEPLDRGAVWERLALHADWLAEMPPAAAAVVSALDLALWQLAAQQARLPLYALLGGRYFLRVDSYEFASPPDDCFPLGGVLLAAGADPADTVAEAESLRRRWGDTARVLVDLEGRFTTPDQAHELTQRLQAAEVFCCLDPFPLDARKAYQTLARELELPLGAGSPLRGLGALPRLLADHSLDLVAVDVRWCGGLTGAIRLQALAEASHLPVLLRAGRWPWTQLQALHLAGTSGSYLPAARPRGEGVLAEPLTVEEGFVVLPTEVGLGRELADEALEPYEYVGLEES